MRTGNLKFGLLALLCLLAVVPIIGNVQKQAAVSPKPTLDRDAMRRARHAYQRRALHQWLLSRLAARDVSNSPESPRIFLVTMPPDLTHAQVLDSARKVKRIMEIYFEEGSGGAVTIVEIRSAPAEIFVQTGLHDSPNGPDFQWHIVEHGKTIE